MKEKPFKFKLRFKYSILFNTFNDFSKKLFGKKCKKRTNFLDYITAPAGYVVYLKWRKYINKKK